VTAPTPAWHVDEALLRRWVAGGAGAASAASVEQHVVRCPVCRARVAEATASVDAPALPDLNQVWTGIRDGLELPRASRAQKMLRRLGLTDADALLLVSAPAMRAAWVNALGLVLAFVGAAAFFQESRVILAFLIVAPLVPMLGVALTYRSDGEGVFEQEAATPYSPVRLVLLRTIAVLAATMPLVVVAGLLLPADLALAWLVPALGFTAVLLAASTWIDSVVAAAVLTLAWTAAVLSSYVQGSAQTVYGPLALFAYSVVGCAALVVFVHRLRRTGTLGGLL
jgi:hypothetical protein